MTDKKNITKVADDPLFKEYCQNHELRPSTIHSYELGLQRFVNFVGKSLSELIEEAEEEEDLNIRFRKRKLNKYLRDYQLHLNNLDLSESYKKLLFVELKAFYTEYDIQLPMRKYRRAKRSGSSHTIEELPTMEDIARFMMFINDSYRAYISLAVSSGMGASEMCSLTFRHLYKALDILYDENEPLDIPEIIKKINESEVNVPKWDVIRVKTNKPYFTFSSPESIHYILLYLDTLHFKHGLYEPKPDDTLLRSLQTNKPFTPANIGLYFRMICNSYGFKKGKKYTIRSHIFRKFFATTLEKNKIPYLSTKWLLGHSVGKINTAYFFADPDAVREDYVEVLDQLTTSKTKVEVIDKSQAIAEEIEEIKEFVGYRKKINTNKILEEIRGAK